jgi:hypothetical protein
MCREMCVGLYLFKSGFMMLELLRAGRQRKAMDISQQFSGTKNGNMRHEELNCVCFRTT